MSLPDREAALHRDAQRVYEDIEGPVAANMASHSRALVAHGYQRRPPHLPTTDEDYKYFNARCAKTVNEGTNRLKTVLQNVPSNIAVQVPLILGQADFHRHEIGPGPNLYASEIELISEYASSNATGEARSEYVAGAIEAMALARRINILRGATFTSRSDGVVASFAASAVFRRGRFYGAYDTAVMEKIHQRLSAIGLTPLDPACLTQLNQAFIRRWAKVFATFFKEAERLPALGNFLRSGDLLEAGLSLLDAHDALSAIGTHSGRLWMGWERVVKSVPEPLRNDAEKWLAALSGQLGSASSPDKPRIERPFALNGDKLLLVSPHRLSADATDLLDIVWSRQYGEKYHRQRGTIVEDTAFEVLSTIEGAEGIAGGKYSSSDGRVQGECDGVIVIGDILFLIEAKGGFVSRAARAGSIDAAKSDIQDTVSEAFYQAVRLMTVLAEDGTVILESEKVRFELGESRIRRTHIVIPTADDMSAIATNIRGLGDGGFLPRGAAPTIIAVQDLLLLADILPRRIDILTFFEFREEALNTSPPLLITDEAEIIGGFISGVDFVAHLESVEDVADFGALVPDITLQRHVDRWLHAKFEDQLDEPPPSRHSPAPRALIEQLERRDITAAVRAYQASRSAAEFAAKEAVKPGNYVGGEGEIRVVAIGKPFRRNELSRDRGYRRARRQAWQFWVMSTSQRGASIEFVSRSPASVTSQPGSIRTTLDGEVGQWFATYQSRRSRPVSAIELRSLEDVGVPRDSAKGLIRRGLEPLFRELIPQDSSPSRTAAFCLDVIGVEIKSAGIEAAAIMNLTPEISELLAAVRDHGVTTRQARAAVRALIIDGTAVVETLAQQTPGPSVSSWDLDIAINRAFQDHPNELARVRGGDAKAARYLAGQIVRFAPMPKPDHREVQSAVVARAAADR